MAEPVTNAPTTLGGTITIEADGNFAYHPDDGDTGVTDTFTYRVCDATPCTASTVGEQHRHAEPARSPARSGTSATTPQRAATAPPTPRSTPSPRPRPPPAPATPSSSSTATTPAPTWTPGTLLEANERLIGEAVALTLDPDGGGPLPPSPCTPARPGARPTLTATGEDVVVLASGATVTGLELDPSGAGGGIAGGTGDDRLHHRRRHHHRHRHRRHPARPRARRHHRHLQRLQPDRHHQRRDRRPAQQRRHRQLRRPPARSRSPPPAPGASTPPAPNLGTSSVRHHHRHRVAHRRRQPDQHHRHGHASATSR